MKNFVHNIPTKILFGKGQIENLATELEQFGKKVLLTYGGGSIKTTGLYDQVMSRLNATGFTVVECDGVEPNPRIETVEKGVRLCKEHEIDVVLAVGGGSTIDCAKAICSGVYYEGDDLWQMVRAPKVVKKSLPLVDILTLAATGSEFDPIGVISNMSLNLKLGGVFTYPSVSICDPTYTFTVPAYQTAAGSADIMSHAMEKYFDTNDNSDVSEGLAETLIKTVIKNLPIALEQPDNYTARANLMYAANLACCGMPGYGKENHPWSCHAMEHELSAFYDITHGVGLAILTPRWMEHILNDHTVGRFAKFARNVWGLEDESGDQYVLARKGIQALYDFLKGNNIPMTLTEIGIGEEYFERMAEDAVTYGRLANAYVPLTNEDVVAIFKACL